MKHLKLYEEYVTEGKRKIVDPDAFTRDQISSLFGSPEEITLTKDMIRVKALLWIYKYQTEEEKQTFSTHVLNGVGFTGTDAEILSSFAKQVINRHFLSEKQMVILRKKIKKYEMQMAKIATHIKKEGGKKDEKIDNIIELWTKENFRKYQQTRIEFPAVKEAVEYALQINFLRE